MEKKKTIQDNLDDVLSVFWAEWVDTLRFP